jgi:hypothetical protein
MNTDKNRICLNFQSYTDNHDTDVSVDINGENVDDNKIEKLLNTFLRAIESELVVNRTGK